MLHEIEEVLTDDLSTSEGVVIQAMRCVPRDKVGVRKSFDRLRRSSKTVLRWEEDAEEVLDDICEMAGDDKGMGRRQRNVSKAEGRYLQATVMRQVH